MIVVVYFAVKQFFNKTSPDLWNTHKYLIKEIPFGTHKPKENFRWFVSLSYHWVQKSYAGYNMIKPSSPLALYYKGASRPRPRLCIKLRSRSTFVQGLRLLAWTFCTLHRIFCTFAINGSWRTNKYTYITIVLFIQSSALLSSKITTFHVVVDLRQTTFERIHKYDLSILDTISYKKSLFAVWKEISN